MAPWSNEQVDALNAYQATPGVHAFTAYAPSHPGFVVLIATAAGWVEHEGGPVVQSWAHAWMTTWPLTKTRRPAP
jgi:hypothetical protein